MTQQTHREAVRITAVETAIVRLPMPRPIVTPLHHITTVDNVLVTLKTDTGAEGIACLWCFEVERARVLQAMVQQLATCAVGMDPRETTALWQRLWRENNFFGRTGVAMMAHSALDVACWDIKAQLAGEPLWRCLGGSWRAVPAYAGGLFLSDSTDQIVQEARDYVRQGFRAIKMRAGAARLAADIERVATVREAVGPDVAIMIDVVQGWTAAEAIRAGRALQRFDLTWLEDPVAFDDHEALAAVAAALDVPVCAGENDYAPLGFARLIRNRCIDIAMPDLQRAGGITGWMRVAALADAHGLPVTPHVFQEWSVHLACAAPAVRWAEYVPWWSTLFEQVPALRDGCLEPPRTPGAGLRFAWNRLDADRVA